MVAGVVLRVGLPASCAREAADIYYEAFGRKMAPLLQSPERGVAVVQPDLNLANAIGAFDGEHLLGLAGLQYDGKRFWNPRVASVVREFGWFAGLPRALVLCMLAAGGGHRGMLYVEALAVRSRCRGRGIGTALLEAAFSFAREHGMAQVGLEVVDTNPQARRLYERMGFVAVKTRSIPLARVSGFTAITDMARRL